ATATPLSATFRRSRGSRRAVATRKIGIEPTGSMTTTSVIRFSTSGPSMSQLPVASASPWPSGRGESSGFARPKVLKRGGREISKYGARTNDIVTFCGDPRGRAHEARRGGAGRKAADAEDRRRAESDTRRPVLVADVAAGVS